MPRPPPEIGGASLEGGVLPSTGRTRRSRRGTVVWKKSRSCPTPKSECLCETAVQVSSPLTDLGGVGKGGPCGASCALSIPGQCREGRRQDGGMNPQKPSRKLRRCCRCVNSPDLFTDFLSIAYRMHGNRVRLGIESTWPSGQYGHESPFHHIQPDHVWPEPVGHRQRGF